MKQNKSNLIYYLGFFILFCLFLVWGLDNYKSYLNNSEKETFGLIETFDSNVNYMDGINVIYWINLDRSINRRIFMEQMFNDPVFVNTPKYRFSAVDGKTQNVFEIVDKNYNFPSRTNVEYACLLSHLEVIRNFYNSEEEIALVLEDDICLDFKRYWKKTLKEIMDEAPSDWEIIQLCYFGYRCSALPMKLYDDETILYSTGAYIINRKGAKKIADSFINNKYVLNPIIDISADIYLYKVMKKYAYKYPYFIFKSENDSTIHSQDVVCHENSKKITYQMLENEMG